MRLKESERELRIFAGATFTCLTGRGSALEGSMELEFRADEEERSRRFQDTNFGERKIEITRYSPRYFFNVDPCLN